MDSKTNNDRTYKNSVEIYAIVQALLNKNGNELIFWTFVPWQRLLQKMQKRDGFAIVQQDD